MNKNKEMKKNNIRIIREAVNVPVEALAEVLSFSVSHMRAVEAGRAAVTESALLKIAEFFHCNKNDLFCEDPAIERIAQNYLKIKYSIVTDQESDNKKHEGNLISLSNHSRLHKIDVELTMQIITVVTMALEKANISLEDGRKADIVLRIYDTMIDKCQESGAINQEDLKTCANLAVNFIK